MKKILIAAVFLTPLLCSKQVVNAQCLGTYTDTTNLLLHDGINCVDYPIVKIGNRWWMAENVNATFYADSTPLVDGTGAGNIMGDYTTKYYFNYNDDTANSASYGKLYTWIAFTNGASSSDSIPSGVQGVCPTNWHIPSDAEWKELEMNLGMSQIEADALFWRGTNEGSMLKESGTSHWISPNSGATNSSGFTALPGGYRQYTGTFDYIGNRSYWWTATQTDAWNAWYRYLYNSVDQVGRTNNELAAGFSVRCVKDFYILNISFSDTTHVSCNGLSDGSATLSVTGGTPPYTYLWSNGQTTQTVQGLTAGNYMVTVSDSLGYIGTGTITITEPDSIIVIYSPDTAICYGDSVELSYSVYGGTNPFVINGWWGWPDSIVSPDSTTAYTITATDANGCIASDDAVITVHLPLAVAVLASNDTICEGAGTTLNAIVSGGEPTSSYAYLWLHDSSTGSNVSVSPTVTTTYSLVVSDSCSISDTATVIVAVETCTGISQSVFVDHQSFIVYPNPNTGQFTLQMDMQEETKLSIKLYHFTGQLIYTKDISNANNKFTQEMDLNEYAKGIYYLQIATEAGQFTWKVVSQ